MENVVTLINEKKLILPGEIIGVAVSGGQDSMALLHKLKSLSEQMDFEVVAIHVDHCIRENSEKDAEFVSAYCKENGIRAYKFKVDAVKLSKDKSLSIEMGAREARYGVFDALLAKGVIDKIALAHHKSDQAETILMHLFRGTGVSGMKGMEVMRNGVYIRPLLNTEKAAISSYVFSNDIPYVEDETNTDDTYQRNFLRNRIFSQVVKVWPNAINSLINFANDCVEDDEFIKKQIFFDAVILEGKTVRIPTSYFSYPSPIVSRMLFKAFADIKVTYNIERVHINLIKNLAQKGENGKKLDLPMNVTVHKEYDYITLTNKEKEKITLRQEFKCGEFEVAGFGSVKIKRISPEKFEKGENVLILDPKLVPKGAIWRFREDGDMFEKFGGGTKKLKSYLADKKIPQRLRNILPVLAYEGEVYAIAGVEISEAVRVEEGVKTAYQITVTKN